MRKKLKISEIPQMPGLNTLRMKLTLFIIGFSITAVEDLFGELTKLF